MAERRTGLGKGLGALIPPVNPAVGGQDRRAPGGTGTARRPVDLLFARTGEAADSTGPDGTSSDRTGPNGTATASGGQSARNSQSLVEADSGTDLVVVPGAEFALVPLDGIVPNPRQPRAAFDEDSLQELADSIKEVGLLQPVVVRRAAAGPDGGYELVMGERRWRASRLAGLTEIPAIVRQTDESDMLRDALLENLHRTQLNPLEEAAAYRQLLDDFGCTQEELSARIARSRPQISNTLRLLRLPPLVQRRVAAGVLSAGHARALLGLEDPAAMERLAQRIIAEGLSVRTAEELVALGEVPPAEQPKRAVVRPGGRRDALDALQDRLADKLDTKVTVTLGKAKGRIAIEFASLADLNRIVGLIDPTDPGVLKRPV